MNKQRILAIFERFSAQNPNPRTELIYHSHFELLISVILSAQATDKSVNKATTILFKVANTPEKILALGEQKLREHIKTIGLLNTKAKNIIKTCALLMERYHSKVPNTREALESRDHFGDLGQVVFNHDLLFGVLFRHFIEPRPRAFSSRGQA